MTESSGESATLREHLRILRRRGWLLLGVVAICVGGAAAWAFITHPVYEARAELVVASPSGSRSAVLAAAAPVLSMLGDPVSALGGGDLATQMQIVDSRPSLEGAWGLMHERPEVLDRLLATGLTEQLMEELPGIVADLGDQPPPSRWPDEWQELLDTLVVTPVEESEIIEVRCEAPDPQRARDFTNALVLAYIGRSLGDARATTRRTRTYVEQQLADVELRLAEAEESLRRFGERSGTVALEETAREQIGLLARLNEQAAVAESTLSARRALREELDAELQSMDDRVVAYTITRRNPEIVELQGELARAEAERVRLLEEYAPESMPVRRATAGVEELRARLRASATDVVDARQEALNPVAQEIARQMIVAEGEELAAERSMRVLRAAAGRIESELSGLPSEQVALLKLQRELELLERFYLALKEKQQEYEITERAKSPASRLVSHAIAPDEPARPRKFLTIAAGLVAGMLLGLLAVGLAEQLDERVHDAQQAADMLGVPVAASLGEGWETDDGGETEVVLLSLRGHIAALCRGHTGPDALVLASHGEIGVAEALAGRLADLAREDGERVLVMSAASEEAEGEGDLDAALSAGVDAEQAQRQFAESEANLVIAVPPADSGLLMASPLLEAGYPLAVIVGLRETHVPDAQGLVALAAEHAAGPVFAIITGGRRSSARYITAGTRT
ncbi:MAG: GumC family protein [Armatimonadota bacterium]